MPFLLAETSATGSYTFRATTISRLLVVAAIAIAFDASTTRSQLLPTRSRLHAHAASQHVSPQLYSAIICHPTAREARLQTDSSLAHAAAVGERAEAKGQPGGPNERRFPCRATVRPSWLAACERLHWHRRFMPLPHGAVPCSPRSPSARRSHVTRP